MTGTTKILACVDGSAHSAHVCDFAAWAGARTGDPVEILHVVGRRETASAPDLSGNMTMDGGDKLLAEFAALDAERAKPIQARARAVVNEAKARVSAAGVANVHAVLRHGELVETLADFENDARFIVIGKRGEAADMAPSDLGSNLERVVRCSQRPVLVVSRPFKPVERFLIAFDGGASACKAVERVAISPLLRGASCELLTVGHGKGAVSLDAASKRLAEAGFVVTAKTLQGEPDEVIARHLEETGADLLVMGAYGHSRIRHLIIGSTTIALVRASTVPVLTVR